MVGGSVFCLQLLVVAVIPFVTSQYEAGSIILYGFIYVCAVIFLILALFWLSSVLIVFPAFFLFRAIRISAPAGAIMGAAVAGLIAWSILASAVLGNSLPWTLHSSCLSSAIITGGVTGFMLARTVSTHRMGAAIIRETVNREKSN